MALIEAYLYDGLTTGTLEVSDTSDTGPWTSFTLSAPLPLREAIEDWRAQADAALGGTYSWTTTGGSVSFAGSGHWVRMNDTLQYLLGFSDPVVAAGSSSDDTAFGIFECEAIARSAPLDTSSGELVEFRGGRAIAPTWGRVKIVTVDLYFPESISSFALSCPMLTGHGRIKIETDATADYSETELEGALTLDPYETTEISLVEGSGDWVGLKIKATMEDL